MLINRNYIIQKSFEFIKEQQKYNYSSKANADKLYVIKTRFPKWLRSIIFHPFNPAYSIFLQYKATRNKGNFINFEALQPFSVDFLQYYLANDFEFDSSLYYPTQDDVEIESFICNRIKSLIPGYSKVEKTKEQIEMFKKRDKLKKNAKRDKGGYVLELDNENYYLPSNIFQEHTYIHEYGLKYLPDYVKEYIAGKDFFDIGAFMGDTSILLERKYKPNHVYAYEPVGANLKYLEQTIEHNAPTKITAVKKGVGDVETTLDIYIDPTNLSSCSINESIANNLLAKETVSITTLDKECEGRTVGLIKMDIEGAEYSAIKGGLETIKRDKPVLLISLYHTAKDFFEIPPMLKEAVPDYLFRFINIEIGNPFSEKILIAYPKQ